MKHYTDKIQTLKPNTESTNNYLETEFANINNGINFSFVLQDYSLIQQSVALLKSLKLLSYQKAKALSSNYIESIRKIVNSIGSKAESLQAELLNIVYAPSGTGEIFIKGDENVAGVNIGNNNVVISKPVKQVIRILFLAANPTDTSRLRLDEEARKIEQALRRSEYRDMFDFRLHWAVRVSDIQELLLRHTPNIVHFSGHGSISDDIMLEGQDGKTIPVPPRALNQLFHVLKNNIRCVVLSSCYSEQQVQAIAQEIECVIGIPRSFGDSAAINFTTAFYQALSYGRSVKTAFELGQVQIDLESLGEQSMPILITKSNPEEIIFIHTD